MTALFKFPGGVHPPDHKAESNTTPIRDLPLLPRYVVPLSQHLGKPAEPCVSVGERVLGGQMIGAPKPGVSAAIHAPTSGRVSAIEARPIAHPSGLNAPCIVIDSDGEDACITTPPPAHEDRETQLTRLRNMGLAGLGGAVFPTHIKLAPGSDEHWPLLILNGAECEPWITCDDRLMREHADAILDGAHLIQNLIGAAQILVGVEDNKPEAIAALRSAANTASQSNISICPVPTLYPMGGGKQLTYALTGRTTPSGGRTTDVGVQVFNVGTAYALQHAIRHGEPLTRRIVTVTGAVKNPGNYAVRIGTPISALIAAAGGRTPNAYGTLIGGPMMGFDLASDEAPVSKMVNCILVKDNQNFPPPAPALPCIRCGACARACPVSLQPFEMHWYARAHDFGKAQSFKLFDCIECGCCDHVCPSHIPLVSFFRYAKSEIWAREQEKDAADRARVRHEFRSFRLEREKMEKAAKHAAAAKPKTEVATAPAAVPDADPEAARKKAILAAAMARAAEARKEITPKNTEGLPEDKVREISEIESRRASLLQSVHDSIVKEEEEESSPAQKESP
ncbi:MAG: electron transport complex subunit RsxC [Betaproteobacteria bacterium]|nr:electron transport complex subunit RsxC [Betaproteobacteria bacterium]